MNESLESMARHVAALVEDALRTLEERDESFLDEVIRQEEEIHDHQTRIVRHGTKEQAQVACQLERIADQAVLAAQLSHHLLRSPSPEFDPLRCMGRAVQAVVKQSVKAFLDSDAQTMELIRSRMDRLRSYRDVYFQELVDHMMSNPDRMEAALAWNTIVRNLEEMGERAVAIADRVPEPEPAWSFDDFLRS